MEVGGEGAEVRRKGSLAGALAGGPGSFRLCVAGDVLDDGPSRVVPCARPHRSEAVGVLPIKDFLPGRKGMAMKATGRP